MSAEARFWENREREAAYLRMMDEDYEATLYGRCDYCEQIGHTSHTCPRRDDSQ